MGKHPVAKSSQGQLLEQRRGKSYLQAEIDLIFLTEATKSNDALLARILRRTPDAIDFVRRWNDDRNAKFPTRARNKIRRQLEQGLQRYGPDNQEGHDIKTALCRCEGLPHWVRESGELSILAEELSKSEWFDPAAMEDAREKILTAIVQRQGQPRFRDELLRAYDATCAVTGCRVEEVLEAAHIMPYRGPDTNCVQNGLLLRADIHILFDRHLIAVDESNYRLLVSRSLSGSEYHGLENRQVLLPPDPALQPAREAIRAHRREFEARCGDDAAYGSA